MFRFVHAADIHLDSPLRGLARYEGAPAHELRAATRQALENLVKLAISEQAAFVLIAGDLYDGDWRDYNTGLFLANEMRKLREAGIRVFVISGNHDAQSQISKSVRLPENVQQLSPRAPETILLDDIGVAIHGRGFSKRSVPEDMSDTYPPAERGRLNIGMLHTSANGREGHDTYAPCTAAKLAAKGYDYWALGHVHAREVLSEEPWIVFPGNIQGRHIREQGSKGCTLVTVEEARIASVEHRNLDVVRWYHCDVNAAGADTGEEAVESVGEAVEEKVEQNEDLLLALRVTLSGPCKAHPELAGDMENWVNQVRAVGTDVSGGRVWIEKVRIRTTAEVDLEQALARDDAVSNLLRTVQDMASIEQALDAFDADLTALKRKLPSELQSGDALDCDTPGARSELLADVKGILIPRLLAGEISE